MKRNKNRESDSGCGEPGMKRSVITIDGFTASQINLLILFCEEIGADMFCTAENLNPPPPPDPESEDAKRRPKPNRPPAKPKGKGKAPARG